MTVSKREEKEEIQNFNRLDDKIADLLREVTQIVEESDKPVDYTEWKAAFFNWITLVSGRLSELSLDHMLHIEQYHVNQSNNEYYADSDELQDSKKLQEHIKK